MVTNKKQVLIPSSNPQLVVNQKTKTINLRNGEKQKSNKLKNILENLNKENNQTLPEKDKDNPKDHNQKR